ncbi:MAG: hypothetical protein JW984_02690 [Deltaproteobacteria bacterium]|uniref:DUF2207 domain-containing protein n=1 Tax=Candidatus Zymogenus saltonus TaxID=2844893 RepID=A0A9D8KDH9_9DELT|nr:hypothetical protein [Candidatus Zymogenus saltonus]
MKRKILLGMAVAFAALMIISLSPGIAAAQDYSFSVPKNYSDVYINQDGSITIIYGLTFSCDSGAHPIDIVDIGLPNGNYNLGSAKASINNVPLTDIRKSTYVTGVEVHLGAQTIQPGQTGTLNFSIIHPKMLFTDEEKEDYASMEFSPTWYGSAYAHGTTDLRLSVHFPKGVTPDETRYHEGGGKRKFDSTRFDEDGRIVFTWINGSASPSTQYKFGVSFPSMYVAEGAVSKPPKFSFFEIIIAVVVMLVTNLPIMIFGGFFFIIIWSIIRSKMRRMKYFPSKVSIEGVGIKRGLTAPEAAVLLELPLDKVVTMILFGLMKKNVVRVEDMGKGKIPKVMAIDGANKSGLRDYEIEFLEAIKPNGEADLKKMSTTMVKMIKDVDKRIKGFSRRETKDYYQHIVDLAWRHVTTANTPELLGEEWSDKLEWIMMDKKFGDRMEETFTGREVVAPRWYTRNYYPTTSGAGDVSAKGVGESMSKTFTSGADLANKMVTGFENFSGNFIRNIESFASGVTRVTNPAPQSSGSYSRSSGGGGCACACACAGCACACAGGGR